MMNVSFYTMSLRQVMDKLDRATELFSFKSATHKRKTVCVWDCPLEDCNAYLRVNTVVCKAINCVRCDVKGERKGALGQHPDMACGDL